MDPTTSPNAEFIQVWNDILVPKLARFRKVFVAMAQPHSDRALALHPVRPGEHVLDVGCGFGETSIQLARMVGPDGMVVGIDPCEPFLATGRADAELAGAANVSFVHGDAQVHDFGRAFDVLFGRFGIMFFANPAAALRNLRDALAPGGRALFLVWRALEANPGLAIAKQIARAHLPPPPDDGATCGPGPFSMSDPDTVQAIFGAAGFADVALEPIDVEATMGGSLAEAIDLAMSLGPAGEIVREAGALGEARRPAIVADLTEAFAPRVTPDGVMFPSASWCITARRAD